MKPKKGCCGRISSDIEFMGTPICFVEAPEPTNIIWENRQVSYTTQVFKSIIVIIVIFILLAVTLVAFYFLKQQTIANLKKYPPSTDCSAIEEQFPSGISSDTFKENAKIDAELISETKRGIGIY